MHWMAPTDTASQPQPARRTSRRTHAHQPPSLDVDSHQQEPPVDSQTLGPPPLSPHQEELSTGGRGRGRGRGRGSGIGSGRGRGTGRGRASGRGRGRAGAGAGAGGRGRGRPPKASLNHPTQTAASPASSSHGESHSDSDEQGHQDDQAREGGAEMASLAAEQDPVRSSNLVAPELTYHAPQHHPQQHIFSQQQPGAFTSALVRPHGPSTAPPPRFEPSQYRPPPAVVTPVPHPRIPAQNAAPSSQPLLPSAAPSRPPPRADRNIDKVVLGDLCFRTWYPSSYGKELLGDVPAVTKLGAGGKDDKAPSSKKDRDPPPMLGRLYVCPSCFKYSKEIVAWWGHINICPLRGNVPGRKIYTHPRGRRTQLVPQDGRAGPKRRRGDGRIKYIEQTVQDEGEWSIWEVDGELFCQNLSLFAKLFLVDKSVFFDVGVFNYFLLVYTPPPPNPEQMNNDGNPPPAPRPQVTGLFSKEKLSWDNNNLACILVFPPWQRKGLGALLIGASYEISRREGLMGGPEKPISPLGKRGYMRFWAGEIARWLLSLDTEQTPDHPNAPARETVVDIKDCSQATWISPEDCLHVLRSMGVVEDAGLGPGKPAETVEKEPDDEEEDDEKQPDRQGSQGASALEHADVKLVPRVRIDKAAVWEYVMENRISLEKACDPAGFVEGYAIKSETSAEPEGVDQGGDAEE